MIVMHGFLGSKVNWRTLCSKEGISNRRKCYLVEMRNHAASDHHKDHDYNVMSDDVVRFADHHQLERFTVMGHSMGGRTSMNLACRYPDRVDGVISVDAAPVDESSNSEAFGSFTTEMLNFMYSMKQDNPTITNEEVTQLARNKFKTKP